MFADNQTRIDEIEEALMLFMAILTGQPEDATADEKRMAQERCAELMAGMRDRMMSRGEKSK